MACWVHLASCCAEPNLTRGRRCANLGRVLQSQPAFSPPHPRQPALNLKPSAKPKTHPIRTVSLTCLAALMLSQNAGKQKSTIERVFPQPRPGTMLLKQNGETVCRMREWCWLSAFGLQRRIAWVALVFFQGRVSLQATFFNVLHPTFTLLSAYFHTLLRSPELCSGCRPAFCVNRACRLLSPWRRASGPTIIIDLRGGSSGNLSPEATASSRVSSESVLSEQPMRRQEVEFCTVREWWSTCVVREYCVVRRQRRGSALSGGKLVVRARRQNVSSGRNVSCQGTARRQDMCCRRTRCQRPAEELVARVRRRLQVTRRQGTTRQSASSGGDASSRVVRMY